MVATPQGSTGYNLANGGPVMAWGVEGYVVSFVAPHSLTARALVVAPGDLLTINNASREEPVEVHVDGRPTCELPPGEDLHIGFAQTRGTLAQLPEPASTTACASVSAASRAEVVGDFVPSHAPGASQTAVRGRLRREALIDPAPCSTNCASRTCC